MANVEFDTSEFREFFRRVRKAARGDFKKELEQYLEAVGIDFLRVLQDTIMEMKVMDTRLLLSSFYKDAENSVWIYDKDDLCLEVGSTVKYASWVNDGHYTTPEGVESRFVPGYWEGYRFIYDPKAEGGMMLKRKKVEGVKFLERAVEIYEPILKEMLEIKTQQWIDKYFL